MNKMRRWWCECLRLIRAIRLSRAARYRIDEMDVERQTLSLYCVGTSTFITMRFIDVIDDVGILHDLSPVQAAWIGYYYGRSYREAITSGREPQPCLEVPLDARRGKYKIVANDLSRGIVYKDRRTQQVMTMPLLELAKNDYVLSHFDPTQACYIGILAGIESVKCGRHFSSRCIGSPPALRLVSSS